jgi:Uma2 family endonuclease
MATAVQIPVSEYLATTYRPGREYVDGELRERTVGKWDHARIQALLAAWFGNRELEWDVIGSTEQRTSVSPSRIRIPDLVLIRPGQEQDVLSVPPVLVVEILSLDDTYSDLQQRCEDYLQMGVETIWLIDPSTRSGRICTASGWVAAARLEVPGTPIYVELPLLFAQIQSSAGSSFTG